MVISSREFRDNQKKYLDMVDKNEQIIVQRGNKKAYALVPVTEGDRFFMDLEVMADIREGIEQARRGEVKTVAKEDIGNLLGL